MRIQALALVTMLAFGAGTARAQAADPKADEAALKYRQSLMEAIGGDMAAIGDILKYGMNLPGHVVVHADSMASHAKLVAAAFERKVTAGPTDSEPAIWEKPDEFAQKVKNFETETTKLAEVARGSDPAALGAQVKAVGKSCGGCHEGFRKPKEESFKRKGGADH
jgi:cytochrome c556